MNIKKYDIIKVNLNPKKWSAQAGIMPCIIIQSNLFNQYSPTLVVVPLTSKVKKLFPSEFMITPSKINWLIEKSRFLWSQIMTVDKRFVFEKVGSLEKKYHNDLDNAISKSLDLGNDF